MNLKITCLLIFTFYSLNLIAQNSNEDFLSNFPEEKVFKFPTLIKGEKYDFLGLFDLSLEDTISIDSYNYFISDILYPKFGNKRSIPLILHRKSDVDVDTIKSTSVGLIEPFRINKTLCYPKIFPISKKNISNNILEFTLMTDTPYGTFIETYVYNRQLKKVQSYVPLFKNEKMHLNCDQFGSHGIILYNTFKIENSRIYQKINDSFNQVWTRIVKLNSNGYYEIISSHNPSNKGKIKDVEINDPDGYTNVRELPSSESDILYKISKGEKFKIIIWNSKAQWIKIYNYKGNAEGWIHKSRLNLDKY